MFVDACDTAGTILGIRMSSRRDKPGAPGWRNFESRDWVLALSGYHRMYTEVSLAQAGDLQRDPQQSGAVEEAWSMTRIILEKMDGLREC